MIAPVNHFNELVNHTDKHLNYKCRQKLKHSAANGPTKTDKD